MFQTLGRALLGLGGLAVVSAGLLAQSRSPAVTTRTLQSPPAGEWLTYGRDQAETHYSPLTQVSTTTVIGLTRAWSTELDVPGTLEATPLVANGVVYVTGPWSTVFAMDARTGAMKWSWDPKLPTTGGPRLCCGAVNRGVALYDGLVFVGLLDGRLVALKADTGMPVWDVQTSVDLKESYSITGAPRVVKGKVVIGNGGPWDRNFRSPKGGDNLFLASILALKPDTGRLAWHFQQVPGDQWDYTTTQPITLADLRIDGRTRKVLLQAPKNGFFYVLDRVTGQFISGEPFTTTNWAARLDSKTGRPIESPQARYGLTPVTLTPGPPGAHNWQPMAFHPGTGLVYFPVRVNAFQYSIDPAYKYNKGGRNLGVIAGPGALPRVSGEETTTASAFLLAWDPVAQKERWRVNFTGAATGSGTLATAGTLVFEADPQGNLVAYHAGTGARLWSAPVGSGAAAPVTYELDGRQYVVIAGGRGGDDPTRVTTFALPTQTSPRLP